MLDSLGLLPLAVLGRTDDKASTLGEVASRIEDITNGRQQNNLAASTAILAGLVLDKEVIKRLLRLEIMQESVIYREIRAEAKAEGKVEGIQVGEASLVVRLLKRRIGELSPEVEARIRGLSVEQLETLGEALLDFSHRDDLLVWLDNH